MNELLNNANNYIFKKSDDNSSGIKNTHNLFFLYFYCILFFILTAGLLITTPEKDNGEISKGFNIFLCVFLGLALIFIIFIELYGKNRGRLELKSGGGLYTVFMVCMLVPSFYLMIYCGLCIVKDCDNMKNEYSEYNHICSSSCVAGLLFTLYFLSYVIFWYRISLFK